MKLYKEEDIITGYIENKRIDETSGLSNIDIIKFFDSAGPLPDQYKYIEIELEFIRSLYKFSLLYYSCFYYLFIVAVITCLHKNGIRFTKKFMNCVVNEKYRFMTVNVLMDYIIMIFLPERRDFLEYNNKTNGDGTRLYIRMGSYITKSVRWEFINPKEKEFFNVVSKYKDSGILGVRELLLGFYYMNHSKYNLNLDTLDIAFTNCNELLTFMLLNNMDYATLTDEQIVSFFKKDKNKMIIK